MTHVTPSKSVDWLQLALESGGDSVLVLDCRSHELYESSHIETSISLAIPGLMLRRFRKGSVPIRTIIPNHEDKERFVRRCTTDTVILYDECTMDWQESVSGSGSVLGLLLQKLWDDGCKAHYLEGGFARFQTEYPEHCETLLDSACPSASPPLSVLGLGGLRITSSPPLSVLGLGGLRITSSPPLSVLGLGGLGGLRISSDGSDDGGGESDREQPSSATESEESPVPVSQLAFPVQILPYLYLGCAKDSSNLDVLGQHNIQYILNVTPNLPNMFEHDGHFRYKQIPISDHWSQNLAQFFPEAISFIDEARSKQCGVLVHCLAGISRSVTVTVAYLMQRLNLSLNDAYDFVKRKKSNISPNFNFMGQLLDFERTLERLHSPCDNRDNRSSTNNQQLYFTTPTNHNVFQLDTLEST